jgi:hypothetical protein
VISPPFGLQAVTPRDADAIRLLLLRQGRVEGAPVGK